MPSKLATSNLEKLKCCRCSCLLSVPPITFTNSEGFLCGRCNPDNTATTNKNVPYEILARHYHFPCRWVHYTIFWRKRFTVFRYENFGCKQKHTFESMKTHESFCEKKPFLCPLLPKGVCLWRGNEIVRHLKENHADCVIDVKIVELDLEKTSETCNKAFIDHGKCFLVQFLYHKAKGVVVCCFIKIKNAIVC